MYGIWYVTQNLIQHITTSYHTYYNRLQKSIGKMFLQLNSVCIFNPLRIRQKERDRQTETEREREGGGGGERERERERAGEKERERENSIAQRKCLGSKAYRATCP